MALLCRIKSAKLNQFPLYFKRGYLQIAAPSLLDRRRSKGIGNYSYDYTIKPDYILCSPTPVDVWGNHVRFFAAPSQFQKKVEAEKDSKKNKLNEHIKAQFVRLVINEEHMVVPIHEALQRAKALELDLVEVDPSAKPPVCKIMDYHKERYVKQVKEKERAKVQAKESLKGGACKEVRFSAKTELKDLKMKADTAKRLMERGYRVKCLVTGTEGQDSSELLSQLSAMIEDVALVEESKMTYIMVRHVKFGPAKKGHKNKKPSNVLSDSISETQSVATASAELEKTGSENSDMDNDDLLSVSESKQDINKMSYLNHDVMGTGSYAEMQMKSNVGAGPQAANSEAAGFSRSRLPNFRAPNTEPSFQEIENRYARNASNNVSATKSPTQSPNYGGHPRTNFDLRSTETPRSSRNESLASKDFHLPQNETRQYGKENKQFEPPGSSSAPVGRFVPPANSAGSRGSQSTGFGIFSAPKVDASEKHRSGVEVSQFSSNSFIKRNSGPCNPATVTPNNASLGSRADESSKWGIFGRESSNSTPGRSFHSN